MYHDTLIHAGCYIIHGGTLYSLSCVASCVVGICCSCNCEWTSSRESTHFDTFTFTFTCWPLHNTVRALKCCCLMILTLLYFNDAIWLRISSSRQHLSYDVCQGVIWGDYQNCSVLYCVLKMCTVISTLRWAVLTVLWIGFCQIRFICIYLCVFCVFLFYTAYVVYVVVLYMCLVWC